MRTAYHYLISLSVRLSVYVCVPFVVFTDCESCTTPISTNPGSMEAGEYGLTRGTCFVAHRLEVVAVAGLMWISWCVLGGANLLVSFFSILLFFERTRHTASMRPPCLIYLSTIKEARARERSCLMAKKASSYRGAYRVPLFNESVCLCVRLSVCPSVCVCQCMCNSRRFY